MAGKKKSAKKAVKKTPAKKAARKAVKKASAPKKAAKRASKAARTTSTRARGKKVEAAEESAPKEPPHPHRKIAIFLGVLFLVILLLGVLSLIENQKEDSPVSQTPESTSAEAPDPAPRPTEAPATQPEEPKAEAPPPRYDREQVERLRENLAEESQRLASVSPEEASLLQALGRAETLAEEARSLRGQGIQAEGEALREAIDAHDDFWRSYFAKDKAAEAQVAYTKAKNAAVAQNVPIAFKADWEAFTSKAAEARAAYETGRYQEAESTWLEARQAAEEAAQEASRLANSSLAKGLAALNRGDGETARRELDKVLQIEPGNTIAKAARERAATIEEVNALLESARAAEEKGFLELARTDYAKARQLDPRSTAAQSGLARVTESLASDARENFLQRGIDAAQKQNWAEARGFFQKAVEADPDDPEARQQLAEAERRLEDIRLAEFLREGKEALAVGAWGDAEAAFTRALQIDPALAEARAGFQQAKQGDATDEQFATLARQAETLAAKGDYQAATARARQALQLTDTPNTEAEATELRKNLNFWTLPVTVTLKSDGASNIEIIPGGLRLRQVSQKQISLKPGAYRMVAFRAGHRDAMKEIIVEPGQPVSVELKPQSLF